MAFLFRAAAGSAGSPKKPPAFWGALQVVEKEMLLLYEAPVVEIIEMEVEKGFAQSNLPDFENVPL